MNAICKSCGSELSASTPNEPCPRCGAMTRTIQVGELRGTAYATAHASGVLICPSPAALAIYVPPIHLTVEAAPSPTRPSLKERRNNAYEVLVDDVQRDPPGSLIRDYLVFRLVRLCNAMTREIRRGLYGD